MSAIKLDLDEQKKRFHARYIQEPNTGCWLWSAAGGGQHYGLFHFRGKTIGAHRASWIFHKGEIPNGLYVLHKCDTRPCVNPDHLFLGTPKDNMQDCVKKGRHPKKKISHCKRGHALVAENLYTKFISDTYTWRACKVCFKSRYNKGKK